jgi:hypothetical protein
MAKDKTGRDMIATVHADFDRTGQIVQFSARLDSKHRRPIVITTRTRVQTHGSFKLKTVSSILVVGKIDFQILWVYQVNCLTDPGEPIVDGVRH